MTDGLFSIPAACVKQIGGLAKTDAPVRVRRPGVTYTWSWASGDQHTDGSRPGAGDRLLLPQSAPALLQVLARHVGLTLEVGEVPRIRWYRYSDIPSCWKLEVEARSMSIRPFGEYGGGWGCIRAPAMGKHWPSARVLAETFVYLARLERLINDGGGNVPILHKSGTCWVLERSPGSEALTVQPEEGDGYADQGASITSAAICEMTDVAEVLTAIEQRLGLTPWEVKPCP